MTNLLSVPVTRSADGSLVVDGEIANVKRFGAKADGVTDDSEAIADAIAFALNNDTRRVFVPNGTYIVNSSIPINDYGTDLIIEGESVYSIIRGNTGGPIFDCIGSTAIRFYNIQIRSVVSDSNPSTVGILAGRSTTRTNGAYMTLRNVHINMHTDGTANGGNGTVGLYNFGAELMTMEGTGVVRADKPLVFANTNVFSITSPNKTIISTSTSMSCVAMNGVWEVIAFDGPALTMSGCSRITSQNLYLSKSDENEETAAIEVIGAAKAIDLGINVEKFTQTMRNTSAVYGARIWGAHVAFGEGLALFDVQQRFEQFDINICPGGHPNNAAHDLFAVSGNGTVRAGRAYLYDNQSLGIEEIGA